MTARIVWMLLAAMAGLFPPAPSLAAATFIGTADVLEPVAVAIDPALDRAFVAEIDGSLAIVDTETRVVLQRIELPCCPARVAVDPASHKVFVAGNGIAVIDGISGAVTGSISVAPGQPDAMAVRDGLLYVAVQSTNQIVVIDVATEQVVRTFPVFGRPTALVMAAVDLYVASLDADKVWMMDPTTGAVVHSATVSRPRDIALTGSSLSVSSEHGTVTVWNAATLAFERQLVLGGRLVSLAYNDANGHLWVADAFGKTATLVRPGDGQLLNRYPLPGPPEHVSFDASASHAWVSVPTFNLVYVLGEGLGSVEIWGPLPDGFVGPSRLRAEGVAPPGAPVTIYENGVPLITTFADATSYWVAPLTMLSEGWHTIVAMAPEERPSPPRRFLVDYTPPQTVFEWRTPPGPSGWNTTPVTVRFRCSDELTGVEQTVIEKYLFIDSASASASATCKDGALNTSTTTVTGIKIDRTAPVLNLQRTPPANSAGWNRTSPVSVRIVCQDAMSGLVGPTEVIQSVSGQTRGVPVSRTCVDNAGNTRSGGEVVKIDLFPPSAAVDDLSRVASRITPLTGTATDGVSSVGTVEVRFTPAEPPPVPLPPLPPQLYPYEFFANADCAAQCNEETMRWKLTPPNNVLPGEYLVSVRATDLAGNTGSWSDPKQVLVVTPATTIPRFG